MKGDLFDDVVAPSVRIGAHRWYSMPLSLLTHVVLVGALLVVPFAGTYVVPMPHAVLAFTTTPLPPAPPAPVVVAEAVMMPMVVDVLLPDAAPVFEPEGIGAEPAALPSANDVRPGPPTFVHPGADIGLQPPAPAVPLAAPPMLDDDLPRRVGGAIGEPRKLHHVDPLYPAVARSARRGGLVVIEATIASTGRVTDARVLRSDALFDQAAIDAVRQWRYTPPTLNGAAIDVIMTVTVRFSMN